MHPLTPYRALAVAAALLAPAGASAAVLKMQFIGVVLPGSTGKVFPYLDVDPGLTAFDGEPMTISLDVGRHDGVLFVEHFKAQWSDQTYDYPFLTGWEDDGLPNLPENENAPVFFSTVDLTANGGHIFLFPTSGFVGTNDASFNLDFNFVFSSPRDPLSSFTDNGLTGGGDFDAFRTFLIDPEIGPYDADSEGTFALTSLIQTAVPEPSAWAVMILGFGLGGAALRRRSAGLATASA